MKLSYNWLKEIIDFDQTPEQLGDILTMLGLELEEIIDYNKIYDKFITASVIKKEPHPDADKLSLCTVEYNGNSQTVVCGAPNVDADQTIILGLEGAIVPSAGFALSKRKIRGIESNGMICSKAELELGEDHDGIWVLPDDAPVGIPLSEYVGLNDVMLDVFVTPNRSDANSHIGVASDIAAYLGKELKIDIPKLEKKGSKTFPIEIKNSENCARYTALLLENVKIVESPDWLKNRLKVIGLRPRNIAVDATNYVMMECGNPLHAFDLDKLSDKIIVDDAGDGESFKTLDDKDHKLDNSMLTIRDAKKPLAIAGVMGGQNSEIDDNTKNILIESAYFNPSSVRRTAKKLSINSDSSYRYERGVDYNSLEYAAYRAAEIITKYGGGDLVSDFLDVYPNKQEELSIDVRFDRIRKIIGFDLANDQIKEIADKFNWSINYSDDKFTLIVPSYRVDLKQEIDVIEEIARLYEYDKIEAKNSSNIDFESAKLPRTLKFPLQRRDIANYLISNGFTETISPYQTDPESADLFYGDKIELANPLGLELSIMRPSAIISFMKIIKRNINLKNSSLALFQLGKSFLRNNNAKFVDGMAESEKLTIALTGSSQTLQWSGDNRDFDFYDSKGIATDLLNWLGFDNYKFKNNNDLNIFSADSQNILVKKQVIGTVGKINKKLMKHFDVEQNVFICEIDLDYVFDLNKKENKYSKVSQYPVVERDLAFLVSKDIEADKILNQIEQLGGKYFKNSTVFDVYEGKNLDPDKKSLAIKLEFGADKTLTDEEVNKPIENIVNTIKKKFDAQLRE